VAEGEPLPNEENMSEIKKAEARVKARFQRLARGAET